MLLLVYHVSLKVHVQLIFRTPAPYIESSCAQLSCRVTIKFCYVKKFARHGLAAVRQRGIKALKCPLPAVAYANIKRSKVDSEC